MSEPLPWNCDQVRRRWPVAGPDDDKYSRGVLGIVAGSDAYPGAAVLTVSGAYRAGIGMVRYVGSRRAQDLVLAARPETVIHDPGDAAESLPRSQAWVVGPGVADHPEQDAAIGAVIASGLPMCVDAGALETVARSRVAGARRAGSDQVLLTPHAGELATTLALLGHRVDRPAGSEDRAEHARLLAEASRATVLLKGSHTIVVSPGGSVISLPPAPAVLATAGAGDVLAGIAGALLAAGLSASVAGACAAWVHAEAATRAQSGGPIAALDVADALPAVVAEMLN